MTGPREVGSGRSPYPGLTPYSEEDTSFFFARARERRLIRANLLASRLTILYGESGVGKTSVLRAGVVPDLNRGLDGGKSDFEVVLFRDWHDPVQGLIDAVTGPRSAGTGSLEEALRQAGTQVDGGVLVILDQFEEYFLYHADEDGDGTFAVEFPRAVERADLQVNFLISIREDALAKLDQFKGRIPALFDNYLRIEHLNPDAAREAIEKPVERYNELVAGAERMTLEPRLVDAVLAQLGGHPVLMGETGRGVGAVSQSEHAGRIETPYLQLVMSRLWNEEKNRGSHVLRLATLTELGGAERIVRTHVDAALSALSPEEQEVAVRLFHHLVTPSGTKIAHSTADIAKLTEQPESAVAPVLAKLSTSGVRILRPVALPGGRTAVGRYEIFHDVLAQAVLDWRLRHVGAQEERRREQARREAEAQRRKDLRNRFLRIFALLLVVGIVVTSALAVLALSEKKAANDARGLARSRELAASAIAQLPTDPELSVLLAREALRVAPTQQAVDALEQALPAMHVRSVMRGHRGGVFIATDGSAFSPDGRLLVTASDDGTAAIWRVRSGNLVHRLRGHSKPVDAAAFSPDGTLVVTGSSDTTARIWDARSGRVVHVLRGHTTRVVHAVFSPDGTRVLTAGGLDETARVWSVASGRLLRTLRGHERPVVDAEFSPDGRRVVTASWDGTARMWDAFTGRTIRELRSDGSNVQVAAFSPDGRRIVTASWNGTARIWSAAGTSVRVLPGDGQEIVSIAFSRDGRLLATGGGKTPRVWDVRNGRLVATLVGHTDWVNTVAFSRNDALVVSASEDGTARVWDAATGGLLRVFAGHTDGVTSASFTPDGERVVTASFDMTARTWDAYTGTVLRGDAGPVLAVAFSASGRRLAAGCADGTTRIWDVRRGRLLETLPARAGDVGGVRFIDHDRRVLTADLEAARIWDLRSGKVLRSFVDPRGAEVDRADLSPDGRRLVTASEAGVARVWDTRTGRVVHVLRHHGWVVDASFSPAGKLIVTASRDRTARIWEASTGRPVAVLRGHGGPLNSASFSRDGRFLVTTSGDRTARIWAVPSGRLVHELRGHTGAVYDAAFSSDGRMVVTVGDTTTRIWDVASGRLLGVLQMHSDTILGVDLDPAGRLIATGGDDQTVRIYSCDTCGPLRRLLALASKLVTRELSRVERRDFLGGG